MRGLGPLAVAALLLAGCTPPAFPEGFRFGAATAGFQVDPGCPTRTDCIDTRSDWYQWTTSADQLGDLKTLVTFEPLEHGPGMWELYAQDFDRAKDELGLDSLRVSLEWSRIFPQPTDGLEGEALAAAADAQNVAAYHAQFAAMKARGLTPMVTLNHYTLPVWIHDGVACHKDLSTCPAKGWLDRERTVREIAKYAGYVAREFGGEVDLWATENEPFAVVLPGYLTPSVDRVNPPALSFKFDQARAVFDALIEAHARMYDAVKAADLVDADGDGTAASVGLVYAMTPSRPKNASSRVDQRGSDNVFYLYNTNFLDGVGKGIVDADWDGVPDQGSPDPQRANRIDWFGINFYTRITVKGLGSPAFPTLSPLTTFDPLSLELHEDYPQGLVEIALWVQQRYGKPMFITETGTDAAGDPEATRSWLVRYVDATKQALAQGADVRGFYYWSLVDNYEWNRGMEMKFGLYEIAQDQAKTRTARSAVQAYREITRQRDVPSP